LNEQVDDLSKNLYKTQKEFLANGREYRQAEGRLHEEF
jgi:hypothetical protein